MSAATAHPPLRNDGGLGMSHANWNQFNTFGFPSDAAYASPLQQIRVAVAFASY